MEIQRRFEFLGIGINATNLEATTAFLAQYDFSKVGYVSFPDSSVIAAAQEDRHLQGILNNSLLTLPDGKPSEFYARLKGYKNVSTVSGFWLSKNLFQTSLTHYILGSTEAKLEKIVGMIKREFPAARIIGYGSPPFHEVQYFKEGNILTDELDEINRLQPDLIWVGLSSPKQDFLMGSHVTRLKHGILLGVGGVFDYLAGDIKKSPEWVKKIGLRWLWRLVVEPTRLGPKYGMTLWIFSKVVLKKIVSRIQGIL